MTEILGWVATAVFVASYFFARAGALRAFQMLGSTLWMIYGLLIGATPVIAANMLVFVAAAWTFARGPTRAASPGLGNVDRIAARPLVKMRSLTG